MLNKMMKVTFLVVFVGLLTACAGSQFYHENIMRGQVVGVDNNEVVICIGSKDGAEKGQLLNVYRVEYEVGSQEGDDGFRRQYIGELKVDAVIDDHFARARSTKGNVKKHDIVELKK